MKLPTTLSLDALYANATPLSVAATMALVLLTYAALPSAQERAVRHLPTPASSIPIFRNTFAIMSKHGRRIYDWLLENCIAFDEKPWRMQVLGRPVTVVLCSVEALEHILKTKFDCFIKGEYTTGVLKDLLGDGIFAADGELWAHQRKTASHLFSHQMMRDTMEIVVRDHCELLCQRLRAISQQENNVVEFKRLLDLFTMDVFTRIGFGVDFGSLKESSNSESKNNPFLLAFERTSQGIMYRFQQPMWLWQLKRWLNVGVERQLKQDIAVINTTVNEIIAKSIAAKSSGDKREQRRDLISLFIEKNPAETVDPALIRDMTISFIAAGRDTTSQSMSWVLLMLNRHPHVLAKLREELKTKAPQLQTGNTTPSMEDIQDLVYLEAVVKESMRLNPVVGITTRTAAVDTTLHDGTFVKAGTRIVLSNYVQARLPSVWGPDATEYKPERWIDPSTGKIRQFSPFKFAVFLAGPRTCLGMKFALMEMKVTLAALLSKFELRTVRDPHTFTYRASMTMSVREPLMVAVTPM
ncbi:hypothetical protein ATCC90586_005097 [Pythium insidiosum]|nr:hypothetical protein ATCC90586_005097 [Pythium insidiosum]